MEVQLEKLFQMCGIKDYAILELQEKVQILQTELTKQQNLNKTFVKKAEDVIKNNKEDVIKNNKGS